MTYECEICNKIIKSYNGFYRHKKRNNCNNKKFTCKHCNNKFKHKSSLSYHVNKTCRVVKGRKIELEELEKIKNEVAKSRILFSKLKCPIIDVTRRSVEETSAKIMQLYVSRTEK